MDLYNVLGGSGFSTKIPKSLMTKVLPFYGTTGKLKVELVEHIDKEDVIRNDKNEIHINLDKSEEFINEEFELSRLMINVFFS